VIRGDRDAFGDEVAHLMREEIRCDQSHAERHEERHEEARRGHQRSSGAHEGRQPDAQVDVISVSELERRAPSNPLAIRRHGVPFGPFPGEGEALDTTLGRSLHNPLDEEAPSAGAIRWRNQPAQSAGAISGAISGRHQRAQSVRCNQRAPSPARSGRRRSPACGCRLGRASPRARAPPPASRRQLVAIRGN